MKRTAVINVVGLSEALLGPDTPHINSFRQSGACSRIEPVLPAVTCTAQAAYLTGLVPAQHGIVANGWYDRELAEVHFWKQSNRLVHGNKLWDSLRQKQPEFTCAQLFWWFNMYANVDWSITPRPMYPADGRKIFDIYAWPYELRTEVKHELGGFPFPAFWGPAAGVDSAQGPADAASRWISQAAQWIEQKYSPALNLVYLPHLDYNLQRFGPKGPHVGNDLRQIDSLTGELVRFFQQRSVQIVLLSEYGITPVDTPVHLNQLFRQAGWLAIKEELGRELLDYGASRVFAVADHQVAHIYCKDRALVPDVRAFVQKLPGVSEVLDEEAKRARGLDHSRSGDLIVVAQDRSWFTYYYWLDPARAPDFARTVDIHRKPGYDPVELFLDPAISAVKAKIAWRLLQKKLGFRMLMDVIPLDATLVRGSHGHRPTDQKDWPLLITGRKELVDAPIIRATDIFALLQRHIVS